MNIEITENAKDYLAKKNKNTIVIKLEEILCWGGRKNRSIRIIAIDKVSHIEDYEKYTIGDYTLFIGKNLIVDSNVVLDSKTFLFTTYLVQSGISY